MAEREQRNRGDDDREIDTDRDVGTPDPVERVREGKDPGWPVPGLPGPPGPKDSPASDADAPAPPG